jgi:hypothetical protein
MSIKGRVLVLDEISVPQVSTAKLHDAYVQRYVPAAQARGLRFEGAWRNPVADGLATIVTLRYMWSVPDVAGWWQMRLGAQRAAGDLNAVIEGDEEKMQWWSFVDSVAIDRKRVFMTDLDVF